MRVKAILSLLFSPTQTNETRDFRLDFKSDLNYADMFSYRFHLAGTTGHGEDIVNDCKKKFKMHREMFLKHKQSMRLLAQNY